MDGGVRRRHLSFGDAAFYGAAPSRPSSYGPRTVTAMVPTTTGGGYWQAATSGELMGADYRNQPGLAIYPGTS